MKKAYDLVIIGGGPAGYIAAIRAAQHGLCVACIDQRGGLGGTCLYEGCIPSKFLLHFTHCYAELRDVSSLLGWKIALSPPSFSQLKKQKERIIATLAQGIFSLVNKHKITFLKGKATLIDGHTVEVKEGKKKAVPITGSSLLISTGSEPIALPRLPFDHKRILSSCDAFDFSKLPKSLIIVGGGAIGLEMGSIYSRLGCRVTLVESQHCIGGGLDAESSRILLRCLKKEGMECLLSHRVVTAKKNPRSVTVTVENEAGKPSTLRAEYLLVCIGRRSCVDEFDLEKDASGSLAVNAQFQTSLPSVYAIGDAISGPMLAHRAYAEAIAVADFLASKAGKVHYISIPHVIYTFPEVAQVGLTEEECVERGLLFSKGSFPFSANSKAKILNAEEGMVTLLAENSSQKIIGMQIIAPAASELIAIGSLAIDCGLTAQQLANVTFPHPTLSEAIKEAALALFQKSLHQ